MGVQVPPFANLPICLYFPKQLHLRLMRCLSCCTAAAYQIPELFDSIRERYKTSLHRNVIHVEVPSLLGMGDVFYFPYGSTVCWGLSQEEETGFLNEVKPFEQLPLDTLEVDAFTYSLGEAPKVHKDEIILTNRDVLTLLAISHGLAQSVKLSAFELAIQKTFNTTKYIPEDLAQRGRITLSRKEIRRKMGELFLERSSINLHFDVLDTPEFFWEYPELEPLYAMIANYLDIKRRVEVLNQRLDVVHELFEMLGNELNHQHSSRLEWTIIGLIVIEVALTLLRDVFQLI